MPVDQSLLGCILSEQYAEESDRNMVDAGLQVEFRIAQSQFVGRWEQLKRKGYQGVFLWELPERLTPYFAYHQRRGTCVSRGFAKALNLAYLHSLVNGSALGLPVEIAYEPIYVGSRVIVGKGAISGDGSCGPWAAEWLAGINGRGGFCKRGIYGSADLTKDNESWACTNADKGDRMPQELMNECQKHTAAVHRLRATAEIADSIASYFPVARCWNTLFGSRDKNGQSVASDTGGHCQAIIGVYVDQDGEDCGVDAQSWGSNNPDGPNKIVMKDGSRKKLPPGCYGVKFSQYKTAMKKSPWWDAFAVSVRAGQEYRSGV